MSQPRITSYTLVAENTPEKLEHIMEALLKDGWQPLGSVAVAISITNEDTETRYAQAAVLYAEAATPSNP